MIIACGNLTFYLIVALSFFQIFYNQEKHYNVIKALEIIKTILLATIFTLLISAFLTDNFSLAIVNHSSEANLHPFYKLGALWSSHEGSMLLWIMLSQIYIHTYIQSPYSMHYKHVILIQNAIFIVSITYVLFFANPFKPSSIIDTPNGLNPILHSPFLIIHPPKLYLGYVGNTFLFAFILGLFTSKTSVTTVILATLQKHIKIIWSFLTIGIALGSKWAYQEISWGGFWGWDPVENMSLLPWIGLLLAMHSNGSKLRSKKYFFLITIISCCSAFFTVITGTIIVRFGDIQSVHSFATGTNNVSQMILFVVGITIATIWIIVQNYTTITHNMKSEMKKLDHLFLFATAIISIAWIIISIGITAPIVAQKFGINFAIESSYYNTSLGYIIAILLSSLILTTHHIVPLKKLEYLAILSISIATSVIIHYRYDVKITATFIVFNLAAIVASQALTTTMKNKSKSLISHIGFSLVLIGAISASSLEKSLHTNLSEGVSQAFATSYHIALQGIDYKRSEDHIVRTARIAILKHNTLLGILTPSIQYFDTSDSFRIQSDTIKDGFSDIYIVAGRMKNDQTKEIEIAIYHKPLINFIWIGTILMIYGLFYQLLFRIQK